MKYLIKMVSRAGQTVLDPYMGSGSMGVACQNTGRSFIGIEKEEQYFRIAEKRIGPLCPDKEVDPEEKKITMTVRPAHGGGRGLNQTKGE